MNKYLLLRDNKQSGPYTVPEIIAKGIKPYDLVWLEGKSAAWRYPSEIEELKAHSPVVEEQPFDRFYKKPGSVVQNAEKEFSRFEPKAFEPAVAVPLVSQDSAAPRKVYINFPGAAKKQDKNETPVFIPDHSSEKTMATNKQPEEAKPRPAKPLLEAVAAMEPNPDHGLTPMTPRKSPDSKILYGAIAACFVLVMLVGILIVNYTDQRKSIKSLNSIVQQMEEREKQDQPPVVQTALRQNTPPPVATGPSPENDPLLKEMAAGQTSTSRPAKRINKETPVIDPSINPVTAASKVKDAPANPPAAEAGRSSAAKAIAVPAENLFRLVSVKPNKFKTGLLGGISNLQMELTNNSQQELHRVAVEIHYLGPEKKIVNTQTVYFENVSPGGQLTIDVPKSRRGVTINYTVTDIKS